MRQKMAALKWQDMDMATSGSKLELYMLDLINAERVANGRDPLQLEQNLNQSAEDHSLWMFEADNFSHTGSGGSSATQRMQDADFTFSGSWRSGENIGFQSERGAVGLFDDVEDIHESLMNSPGHRTNILNSDFDYIGIGIEYGDYKGYDGVMITQNYAKTSGPVILDGSGGGGSTVPSGPEPIIGSNGANTLRGTQQDDLMQGLGGKDILIGLNGDDRLEGGAGNDHLRGGGGADDLIGGNGLDRADYSDAGSGVRADLGRAQSNTGDAEGDSYSSIEWLVGSSHTDVLVGTDEANRFWGAKGHDKIYGQDGDDIIRGGSGHDKLSGQGGDDILYGNGGNDDFIFTHGGGQDVVKDFQDNRDELDFTALGFANKSVLFAKATEVENDVVFAFSDANGVTVEDMTILQLQDDVLI